MKRRTPSKSESEKVLSCDHCRIYEQGAMKNPVFDETHVLFHTRHYPWAMGWDKYIQVRTNKKTTPWHEEAYVITPPKKGDQVVICSHRDFWPFERGIGQQLDWKQLCGTGIIRAMHGRELAKDVEVEIHEWFHPGVAPKRIWLPLYHVCQTYDLTRVRQDLLDAWNFVGISRKKKDAAVSELEDGEIEEEIK